MTCITDPYGNPYIPGSSLKGMLRTLLLGRDILQNCENIELIPDRSGVIWKLTRLTEES